MLTAIGDYDWGICEFARVSNTLLPAKTYERMCPELFTECWTASGTLMHLLRHGGL